MKRPDPNAQTELTLNVTNRFVSQVTSLANAKGVTIEKYIEDAVIEKMLKPFQYPTPRLPTPAQPQTPNPDLPF